MSFDDYAKNLGSLVANFHSLEFALRAFLQDGLPLGVPHGTDIYSYPVGAELPENEFTSFDSLGQLIDRYNRKAEKLDRPQIDKTLVEIRDALAHGRVSAATPGGDLRLLKFSKPANGRVLVVFNEKLSSAWLTTQRKRVYDAAEIAHADVL